VIGSCLGAQNMSDTGPASIFEEAVSLSSRWFGNAQGSRALASDPIASGRLNRGGGQERRVLPWDHPSLAKPLPFISNRHPE
jgi:hypothetical protein